jgi:hypothetical protein
MFVVVAIVAAIAALRWLDNLSTMLAFQLSNLCRMLAGLVHTCPVIGRGRTLTP